MANSTSHAALPYPVKGARFTIPVPYLDADGDPTDPTTPDTEISKDAGAFADCAEEVSTISGSNGAGYITLSGAEMDCALAVVAAKVASGPKATLVTLQPRVLPVIETGTAQAGAAGTITLASAESAIDDYYVGCIVKTTGGTGGGGTGGANNQARVITDYVGSTKVASVSPNWETNPSSDTTYDILLTENAYCLLADVRAFNAAAATASSGRPEVNTSHIAGSAVSTSSAQIGVNVVNAAGTAWNSGAIGASTLAADTITAAKIAADAITAAKIADGAIDAGAIAADAITNTKIADGALSAAKLAADTITAAKVAADVTVELQSGLATASALSIVEGKIDTLDTNVDTLLTRITSTLFSGITSLAEWLGLIAGKQTGNSTARTELRATGAGSGTYDETTDSQEAIRDRGDAAWTTATGFSTLDAAGVRTAVGLASANLDTQLGTLATAANLATLDTVADAILAILDDARGEPGQGAPPVNPDMATKVDYLYKMMRNKITQNATTLSVFADDGSTVDHKATVSDDGTTYTRGELITGA